MTAQQKDTIVNSGNEAFLSLVQQIDHMLDVIHFYMNRYPPETISLEHKHEWVKEMINTLGSKPNELAEVIRRWRHEEPRIISRLGVEIEMLNELWITLDVLQEFFDREHIETHPYNRLKAKLALKTLLSVNNVIQ